MTPSVRPENRFRFNCPVVGREERYIACVLRKHRHWRGEAVDCGGCASAMNANKCPAIHMIAMEVPRDADARSIFFDLKGEKVFGIPNAVAERIERVLVLPSHCRRHNVSAEMFERLTGRSADGVELAPLVQADSEPTKAAHRRVRREAGKATQPKDALGDILDNASVDIAAAITAAG